MVHNCLQQRDCCCKQRAVSTLCKSNALLLRNLSLALTHGQYKRAAELLRMASPILAKRNPEDHMMLAIKLTAMGFMSADDFNTINRCHLSLDIAWESRVFLAQRAGDLKSANVIKERHAGEPYLLLDTFLQDSLAGRPYVRAEEHHRYIVSRSKVDFPLGHLERVDISRQPFNGIICFIEGLGEVLMCLNLLRRDRALARTVKTAVAGERYHPIIRYYLPWAKIITPQECRPTKVTYSSDLIFMNYETTRKFSPLLQTNSSDQKLIGIAWRGGWQESGMQGEGPRSVDLRKLLTYLPEGNFTYVSLQYNITSQEFEILSQQTKVKGLRFNVIKDHVSLMKLCSRLSGMISVEGTCLHLAGQFNLPTLALMEPVAPYCDGWQWYQNSSFRPPYDNFTPCARDGREETISGWLTDINCF